MASIDQLIEIKYMHQCSMQWVLDFKLTHNSDSHSEWPHWHGAWLNRMRMVAVSISGRGCTDLYCISGAQSCCTVNGRGTDQSIWSTDSDAIIRSLLWPTATGGRCILCYFSIATLQVVDNWPPKTVAGDSPPENLTIENITFFMLIIYHWNGE